jgi:hypothetical protein
MAQERVLALSRELKRVRALMMPWAVVGGSSGRISKRVTSNNMPTTSKEGVTHGDQENGVRLQHKFLGQAVWTSFQWLGLWSVKSDLWS